MHSFARDLSAFARRHNLWPPGARILVALSGGPDSSALLLALDEAARAAASAPFTLVGAAHFHHGLRGPDADADAAFAAGLCARLGLPCVVGLGALSATGPAAPNDAARRARYAFLREAARDLNATHVATAHTADDQAETVLLRVLRGASVDGLAGIRARRPLENNTAKNSLVVVRPLLEQSRAAVEAYLADRNVAARRDPSNENPRYARARVRALLPGLAQDARNPHLPEALCRLARTAAIDADLLGRLADDLWRRSALLAPQQVSFDAILLRAAHPALRRRVLLRALRHAVTSRREDERDDNEKAEASASVAAEQVATMASVDALEALLLSGAEKNTTRVVSLPGGVRAAWRPEQPGARLVVTAAPATDVLEPYSFVLPVPGNVWVRPAGLRVRASWCDTAFMPVSRRALAISVALPAAEAGRDTMNVGETEPASSLALQVRPARPGERFAPLGMNGRTRPVRDVMAGAGWPPALRETCPVVARRDTGEILWIVGLAQAETSRVTPLSKQLLRLVAEPDC